MGTLQQDCEAIGADIRELEAAITDPAAKEIATRLHQRLAQGFADHIRPGNPDLDWNAIAGTTSARPTDEMAAMSGGKHEPQASDQVEGG